MPDIDALVCLGWIIPMGGSVFGCLTGVVFRKDPIQSSEEVGVRGDSLMGRLKTGEGDSRV